MFPFQRLNAGLLIQALQMRAVERPHGCGGIELTNGLYVGIKCGGILVACVVEPIAAAVGLEIHLRQDATGVPWRKGLHDVARLNLVR